jgi:H+/Cl- antiporter ClcA
VGAGAGGGAVAQPPRIEAASAAVAPSARQDRCTLPLFQYRPTVMWWLALEIALGLLLFILLVWWTLPRKSRSADKAKGQEERS